MILMSQGCYHVIKADSGIHARGSRTKRKGTGKGPLFGRI